MKVKRRETKYESSQEFMVCLFFSWPGRKRHLWSECAWGSTVCFHFRTTWQTNSDRFVHLFSLLFLLTPFLKLWENTQHKYISACWVCMFSCSSDTHVHTHTQKQICTKWTITIESWNNGRKLKETVPSQFTDTTNGFLAAPWNQAAVMSMHQQREEGEPSP